MEKDVSIWPLLMIPEEKFLQKFVMPYKEEASELLKLYEEKLDLSKGPLVDKA